MQSLLALQGVAVDVTEQDLARAERGGDMPRRDPGRPAHHAEAAGLTPEAAKERGNAAFKAKDLPQVPLHVHMQCQAVSTKHLIGSDPSGKS